MPKYIILEGGPSIGFTAHGPFDSTDSAERYSKARGSMAISWLLPITETKPKTKFYGLYDHEWTYIGEFHHENEIGKCYDTLLDEEDFQTMLRSALNVERG